jgi:ectoine hydroxylase-related dioxygenase (phytanoyl-CoA dioxygenase family)
MITRDIILDYAAKGIVCLPGVFTDWVTHLGTAIDAHLDAPGPNASEHVTDKTQGRFFEDYLSWERIEEYRCFIFRSGIGKLGAELMRSDRCQLFADHVFVKEPGTHKRTTWHQDASYSPFEGVQSINAWIALDSVARNDGLQFIPGSHLWNLTLPSRSFDSGKRYEGSRGTDPESVDIESQNLVSWDLAPGDALFFDSRILHGTMEESALASRRRAFCVRMTGDDVRYVARDGVPAFPWTGLISGQKLPEDAFPVLYFAGAVDPKPKGCTN